MVILEVVEVHSKPITRYPALNRAIIHAPWINFADEDQTYFKSKLQSEQLIDVYATIDADGVTLTLVLKLVPFSSVQVITFPVKLADFHELLQD